MLHRRPAIAPVVDAQWLADHGHDVVLADVRWFHDGTDPLAEHARGHLPGAVLVDLDRDLAGPVGPGTGRHPLPTPEAFATAMGRLGIPQDRPVVAYDQGPGGFAARLVWMLRVTGHDAALLDGGLAGWDGPLEAGEVVRGPTPFRPRPWPEEWLADLDEVVALSQAAFAPAGPSRGDGRGTVLVDARAAERYRGEVEPLDPRAGHVPGAVSVPFSGNLGADGRFLPVAALAERFSEAGLHDAEDVVVYCGSGVTACHDLLALELAGIQARLFPGSWSQWSSQDDLPAATGPEPR